ncbi:MAG: hypothetical protein ACI9NT_001843 [Bacteroidia bacterium]|jgi:uncharacterized protein YehS (DUF1456 family)
MKNNELLQSICTALELAEQDLGALLALCGHDAQSESDEGLLQECSNEQLRCVLEGLILERRPPRSDGKPPVINKKALSNNEVLKKLRIALNLQQEDMLLVFEEGGATLSETDLGALFRKQGNKHFRACSDAMLLQFLGGLNPSLDT